MKTILKIIPGLLIVMLCFPALSQQLVFEQKYTGISILPPCFVYRSAYPLQVQELPDNNILMLGWGQSIDSTGVLGGRTYHELKKLDKNGNILWTKYFMSDTVPGVNTELWFKSFHMQDNGNILLVGEKLNGSSPGYPLAYVDMLNPAGEKVFDTIYCSPSVLMKPQCSAKSANGLAIGGYRAFYGDQYAYAIKIDSNFNKVWEFQLDPAYGGTYSDFRTIISNSDGTYDCFGQMRWGISGGYSFLFVRLDSQGHKMLVKTYSDSLTFLDACAGPGCRMMLGYCAEQDLRILVMKTDVNGNLVWEKRYHDSADVMYLPNAITMNHEDEYLITGEIGYHDPVNMGYIGTDIYLLKTDSAGNKIWDATYGTNFVADSCIWSHWECGRDVVPAMDGSYLVCASDNIDMTYGPVLSLLKIEEGMTGINPRTDMPGFGMVYPNPFHYVAVLQLPPTLSITDGEMKVYDIHGKMVLRLNGRTEKTIIISRNNLPAGVYFYTLEDHNKFLCRGKFMIE